MRSRKQKLTDDQIEADLVASLSDPSAWDVLPAVPACNSPRPAWMLGKDLELGARSRCMPSYDPAMSLGQARAAYFAASEFSPDGGYGDRWVKLRIGRFFLPFPNTEARVRAVRLHDIHHVLTGYGTTWAGEAEIGAWEIASGCGRHYPAWILNFGALTIGLALAPARAFRAFVRGRHSHNLYGGEFQEALLGRSVGSLRQELAIPGDGEVSASPGDLAAFVAWSLVSVVVSALPWVAAAAGAVWLLLRLE